MRVFSVIRVPRVRFSKAINFFTRGVRHLFAHRLPARLPSTGHSHALRVYRARGINGSHFTRRKVSRCFTEIGVYDVA